MTSILRFCCQQSLLDGHTPGEHCPGCGQTIPDDLGHPRTETR